MNLHALQHTEACHSTVNLYATAQWTFYCFRMPCLQDTIREQEKCVRRGSHSTALHDFMPCLKEGIDLSC